MEFSKRSTPEEQLHNEVIAFIKKSVYPYPSPARPTLLTFINHPTPQKAIKDSQGEEYYPDIVIINTEIDKVVMIGEVETESTINDKELKQWQKFSELCSVFYIFYPKGNYERISKLCEKIKVTGFFEYEKVSDKYIITRRWPT
ncbi:MAG: hypothetical protein NZ601_01440 [candidate division WOR-3 bacterium]|nr:hypothetical protein [candidate division WOR-3 bacterium]MCX7757906.1 hypothetical protein [candidate division WOR-3 bacterium]MDW7987861.1 hypothetical protein [candidate division WOR-3 bacterium]